MLKVLSWPEVFAIWRKNEDYPGSHWISHWQARGFVSWEEWRMTFVQPLGLDKLDWSLYQVFEPQLTVSQMRGGPFRSWIEGYYEGVDHPTFSELAEKNKVQEHQGILNLVNNFPVQTIVSGVILKDKIVIVEGMHRCAALALALYLNKPIRTDLKIALAEYNKNKLLPVGKRTK